ncbi:endothelin-converting enzyme 2-like [Stomoxys calcitrans]|uniref:endothelin-converting enzyme 2-like n=1 Tax=Stomoxys calcitrans TaxID=35570 RepID=UPI0027E38FB7|nr:endothelin-converting enzyme 2-like [Stomoxys calcitrans]
MASLPAKRLLLILYLCSSFWPIITCFHSQSDDTNEQLLNTIQSYMRPEINAYRCHHKSCIELNDYNVSHLVQAIKPWQEEEWPKRGDSLKSQNEWNIWTTLGRMAKYGFNEIFLPGDLRLENNGLYVWDLELYEPNWSVAGAITYPYYDGENEELITMAQRIYDFLEELAQLSKKHTKDEAKELSFKEFQRELPHIDLAAYIWERLGIKDGEKFMITVKSVAYYQQLTELIKRTSEKLLINLLRDSFVYHFRGEMPSDAWHRSCVHTLRKLIPLALDFLYNEEVYATVKTDTNKVIESVYHAVKTKFQQLKENDFYFNYLSTWKFKHESLVLRTLKDFSPFLNVSVRSIATPFYSTAFNYIGIPFAYIRYPMIHSRFHALFLYAELGNTLGHELMHGFDTDGVTYDSSGSTWPLRIYNKTSFAQGLECLRQEYTTNINEKLADFSGFRLAYESYFHRTDVEEFSGKTSLTNKQLFYVKFAQLFCTHFHISYDASHDSPTLRVSQIVSNSPDFEEIFACPAKEVMKKKIEKLYATFVKKIDDGIDEDKVHLFVR